MKELGIWRALGAEDPVSVCWDHQGHSLPALSSTFREPQAHLVSQEL